MDYKGIKDKMITEVKKISSFEDLKEIDKRISIPVGILLIVLTIFYYYYLFAVYPGQRDGTNKLPNELKAYLKADYFSFMKPSDILGDNSSKKVNNQKIPSNFMKVNTIDEKDKPMYIFAFDILFDYIKEINSDNYSNALRYLDSDFINENNISIQSLRETYTKNYSSDVTFMIEKVSLNNDSYIIKVSLYDFDSSEQLNDDVFIIKKNSKGKLRIVHQLLTKNN